MTFPPHTEALIGSLEQDRLRRVYPDANRIWRAMMLAPSLDVCKALLRGERVPVERLNPEWVRRLGGTRP